MSTPQELLIQNLQNELERVRIATDVAWTNSNGYIIFLMQAGFCLLEAGSCRYKNHLHTIALQVLNALASVFGWWIVGFAFAYGEDYNSFIGKTFFAGHDLLDKPKQLAEWIMDMASAATAAKIVSGAILERVNGYAYFFFGIFMSAWIYPIGIHWAWSEHGWLKTMGYIDQAGSGVVHMTGGAAALAACIVIGPRLFRFEKKNETDEETKKRKLYNHKNFEGNFTPFTAIGTLLLWYCWFGFNCGSTHAAVSVDGTDNSSLIGIIGVNTSIGACAGGFTLLFIGYIKNKRDSTESKFNIGHICNGLLAGAVAITAGCGVVYPYAAFIIGSIAGLVYYFYQWLIEKLQIDDPLHAGPIHLGTGSLGVALVGVFHRTEGFLYGGGGKLFGVQLLGMVCFFAWSFAHSIVFFLILKALGVLRVTEEEEIFGLDVTQCGGALALNYDEESLNYYAKKYKDILNLNPQYIPMNNIRFDTNHNRAITTDRRDDEGLNVKVE